MFLCCDVVQCLENACRARIDVDRRDIAIADHAVTIEHEERPFANTFLFAVYAILSGDLPLGLEIRQQREVKATVFFVSQMAPDAVDRNRYQRRVQILKLLTQLVIQRQLVPADRTPVGWVEYQNNIAAL